MSPIPSNRYDEAIFAIGIIKKVTGEKRQGVVTTPLGVRGLKSTLTLGYTTPGSGVTRVSVFVFFLQNGMEFYFGTLGIPQRTIFTYFHRYGLQK